MLNVSSEIGKELDSLSDLVSFGVAPNTLKACQHQPQLSFWLVCYSQSIMATILFMSFQKILLFMQWRQLSWVDLWTATWICSLSNPWTQACLSTSYFRHLVSYASLSYYLRILN